MSLSSPSATQRERHSSADTRRERIVAGLGNLRSGKVQVAFRPIGGNVPVLKDAAYMLPADLTFYELEAKIQQKLKLDRVFLYLQNSFTPDGGDRLADLLRCFKGPGEKLAFSYSTEPAYS